MTNYTVCSVSIGLKPEDCASCDVAKCVHFDAIIMQGDTMTEYGSKSTIILRHLSYVTQANKACVQTQVITSVLCDSFVDQNAHIIALFIIISLNEVPS